MRILKRPSQPKWINWQIASSNIWKSVKCSYFLCAYMSCNQLGHTMFCPFSSSLFLWKDLQKTSEEIYSFKARSTCSQSCKYLVGETRYCPWMEHNGPNWNWTFFFSFFPLVLHAFYHGFMTHTRVIKTSRQNVNDFILPHQKFKMGSSANFHPSSRGSWLKWFN